MTKGADGSTRVITQTIPGTPKPTQNDGAIVKANAAPQKEGPQKVQIIRAPDGNITVRGLLAGQQLIKMADGKLHVVMTGQQGSRGQLVSAASPAPKNSENPIAPAPSSPAEPKSAKSEEMRPTAVTRIAPQTPQQLVVQGNRQLILQSSPQMVVQQPQPVVLQPTQQMVVQAGARGTLQNRVQTSGGQPVQPIQPVQTVVMQGQLLSRPAAVVRTAPTPVAPRPQPQRMRPPATQQIVVNNPALVQQIAAGKIQLATVNGQQVLIRPTGNNQAQIVAHIGPGTTATPAPALAPVPPPPPSPRLPAAQPQQQQLTEDELVEKRLLVGQPPGTVIKTVTAQVNYHNLYLILYRWHFVANI